MAETAKQTIRRQGDMLAALGFIVADLRDKVTALREALSECESILARQDTLRHLEPTFPALDEARRVLAETKPDPCADVDSRTALTICACYLPGCTEAGRCLATEDRWPPEQQAKFMKALADALSWEPK